MPKGSLAALQRFSSREEKFYIELIRETHANLLTYARLKTPDVSQAEDIVQETFLTAWDKIGRLMSSPNPAGWLMNVLKNHLRKHYDGISSEQRITDVLTLHQDAAASQPEPSGEASFTSVLSPDELRIAALKEQGYKHHEIAAKLGAKQGTIDSKVSRIKAKITRFLDDN
jgi:RNA polymerase sigma-70 factor (ECF subfamily)